jgi:hypothetical protein
LSRNNLSLLAQSNGKGIAMKWLLIASALNLNVSYDTENTCRKAQVEIANTYSDIKVICIPAGMSQAESEIRAFLSMLDVTVKSRDNLRQGQ